MKAMILAAGRGTRMGALTESVPKPLLPLAGMPLIEYHVRSLAAANIREIVINVSWLGTQIVDSLGDGKRFGVDLVYSDESHGALETAGGIANALPLLGNDPFIVINGDIWTDFPLHVLPELARNLSSSDLAHLIMVNNPEHNAGGDFYYVPASENASVCSEGRLSRNSERANKECGSRDPAKSTFSGLGVYRREFFKSVEGRQPLGPLFSRYIDQDLLGASLYSGLWWDVGTPDRLAQVEQFLRGMDQDTKN